MSGVKHGTLTQTSGMYVDGFTSLCLCFRFGHLLFCELGPEEGMDRDLTAPVCDGSDMV